MRNGERRLRDLHGFGFIKIRLVKKLPSDIRKVQGKERGDDISEYSEEMDGLRIFLPKQVDEIHTDVPMPHLDVSKAQKAAERHQIAGEFVRYKQTLERKILLVISAIIKSDAHAIHKPERKPDTELSRSTAAMIFFMT